MAGGYPHIVIMAFVIMAFDYTLRQSPPRREPRRCCQGALPTIALPAIVEPSRQS